MLNSNKNDVDDDGQKDLSVTWYALSAEDAVSQLHSAQELGLTTEEATRRIGEFGPNELKEKPRPSFFQLLLDQLKSFVIILLIVASILSFVLGEYIEASAILAIVLLNGILGVVQESRAEEAFAALKKMSAPEAHVLRDGTRISVPATKVVPGDIVFLEAGNYIPADVRLLSTVNLKIDEASLTGESLAVEKNAALVLEKDSPIGDRKNTAFMGTVVTYGRGKGVVTSTGMNTQLGLIAGMLQSVGVEITPLQRRLDQLGRTLGYAAIGVVTIVFLVGLLEGGDPLALFMTAISLAVAAVPEGLPAIVTISLALGMKEMIKRHALIRRLSSVETLGSATVICSDKTGTLTQNIMTVTRIWADGQFIDVSGTGYEPVGDFYVKNQKVNLDQYEAARTALWVGALNNDAKLEESKDSYGNTTIHMVGDPTEGSILVAAYKAGAVSADLEDSYPRENEIPFDSDRKRMVTIHSIKNPSEEDISPFVDDSRKDSYVVAVKGAPDIVLKLCNRYQPLNDHASAAMDDAKRRQVLDANDVMTRDALRVLGVAYRVVSEVDEKLNHEEVEKDLIFVGLLGMIDPARPEVTPAIKVATNAGIRTVMITGDYPNTARAIAENIGLLKPGHQVLTGAQLDAISDEELTTEVEKTDVFARVSPEHKMRIVDALKSNGEIVAMTGDGVNDAPAIKRADIGVAMGITGTDVAKQTADMVLTDDNYVSIVSAVEQGRIIYSNIRKFVYYLISCNLAEILVIFLPSALGPFIPRLMGLPAELLAPLAPVQLLWLNLITDGAPALALGTEKGDPDIMDQKPRPPKEPIINSRMWVGVITQTIAITAVVLLAFWRGLDHDIQYAETMAFVTLSMSELLRAYTARSESHSIFKIGVFSNKWMNYAVLASMVLIFAVVYIPFLNPVFRTEPLGWQEWELVLPLLIVPSVVAEIVKLIQRRIDLRKRAMERA
ncbi:MAG: cation-translocating P-type ATPase [Anaerolineaceae bacterium]